MNLILLAAGAAAVYLLQMLLCRLLWERKLDVTVRFSDRQVRQGDRARLTMTVQNGKLIPSLPVKVNVEIDRGLDFQDRENLAVSDRNYRSEIFAVSANERVEREIPLVCSKRGWYEIGRVDLVGTDLFFTRRYLAQRQIRDSLCVLPGRADPAQVMAASRRISGETVVPRADCDDPFTLRGIRPYQITDPIRDINWKATARTGDLRVNVHDRTADQEILILLDLQWDALLKPDGLLEESIRIAASLADEFAGRGIPTALMTNGKDIKSGEPFRIGQGADARHSEAIRTGLARIRLDDRREASMEPVLREAATELAGMRNRNLTAVFITTETGDAIGRAWAETAEHCARAFRIQPVGTGEELPFQIAGADNVIRWEVPYGA